MWQCQKKETMLRDQPSKLTLAKRYKRKQSEKFRKRMEVQVFLIFPCKNTIFYLKNGNMI